jgi:hypothetical protein
VGAVLLILIVNRLFLAIRTSNPIYVVVVLCLRQPLEPTSTSSSILAHRSKRVGAAAGNTAECDISQKEILYTQMASYSPNGGM